MYDDRLKKKKMKKQRRVSVATNKNQDIGEGANYAMPEYEKEQQSHMASTRLVTQMELLGA